MIANKKLLLKSRSRRVEPPLPEKPLRVRQNI
jgi:hypothetical protein